RVCFYRNPVEALQIGGGGQQSELPAASNPGFLQNVSHVSGGCRGGDEQESSNLRIGNMAVSDRSQYLDLALGETELGETGTLEKPTRYRRGDPIRRLQRHEVAAQIENPENAESSSTQRLDQMPPRQDKV